MRKLNFNIFLMIKIVALLLILITFSSCVPISNFDFSKNEYISRQISTDLRKKFLINGYKDIMLELGRLSMGGSIDNVLIKEDNVIIEGVVLDATYKPLYNITISPIQKKINKLSKQNYYVILEEYSVLSNENGQFSISIPIRVKICGLVRYKNKTHGRISTWLFE